MYLISFSSVLYILPVTVSDTIPICPSMKSQSRSFISLPRRPHTFCTFCDPFFHPLLHGLQRMYKPRDRCIETIRVLVLPRMVYIDVQRTGTEKCHCVWIDGSSWWLLSWLILRIYSFLWIKKWDFAFSGCILIQLIMGTRKLKALFFFLWEIFYDRKYSDLGLGNWVYIFYWW